MTKDGRQLKWTARPGTWLCDSPTPWDEYFATPRPSATFTLCTTPTAIFLGICIRRADRDSIEFREFKFSNPEKSFAKINIPSSYHGPFVPWTIHCTDYFDNIFYFIKAERVQSNHLLLDPKYYVFKQWQNLIVVFHCRFLLPTRFSGN